MSTPRPTSQPTPTRRQVLLLGAASALAAGGILGDVSSPAVAAPSPKLPGEQGRQNNLVSRYGGTVFDHIRVRIAGDDARLFIPQGIVPGSTAVPVLWLYHGAGSSHDALTGGFRGIGERATDLGMIAICQNLGGTLYTNPTAKSLQVEGWDYLSGIYGIDRNFLRGTSHGGAMAAEASALDLFPHIVGAYIVNGVYDVEHMYLYGTARARYSVGEAYGYDLDLIRAHNPARHTGQDWSGSRLRVVYSTPDSSDETTPPAAHAKALIAAATPAAIEVSARTHTLGHTTPGFADSDNQSTMSRWMDEIAAPQVRAPLAHWGFVEPSAPFAATTAGIAALTQGPGSDAIKVSTPFGGGIRFDGTGDHLRIAAADVGALNIGATGTAVTVAAWVYSEDTNAAVIAGCWDEASVGGRRAYALFNDLPTYGGNDRVCMNVSKSGGPTAGYPHSIDYAADPRAITRRAWQFHVGTYDGAQAIAYLDGAAEPYPSYTDSTGATYAKNPYGYSAGLNSAASDFVVGASIRNGSPNNLHRGIIAGLRVWNVALSPQEVAALYDAERGALA